MRQLKLGTCLAKPIPSKYHGPHKVSASWPCSIFTAAVSDMAVICLLEAKNIIGKSHDSCAIASLNGIGF